MVASAGMASRAAFRAARAALPGGFIALPAAASVWDVSVRASWATLGRDQGIFQYIAWAVLRGDVLYRDIRDVNGPLVAMLHVVGMALGGANEHRFRVLDLVATALTAAFAGTCLASLDARAKLHWESVLRACLLGTASWAVISAHYVAYGYWDTAQRESFFDWFVLTSVGAQILGQSCLRKGATRQRLGVLLLASSGAASVIPCFGKPTFALFTIGQLAALLVDDLALGRLRRLAYVLLGQAVGALPPIAFVLLRGDASAWMRITFVDVPAMYRFIWPRTWREIFQLPGYGQAASFAVLGASAVAILVAVKWMPRRALVLVVMPIAGLASVAIQAKGFPYHFHPVTAGTSLALVALVHAVWVRAEAGSGALGLVTAGVLATALGVRTAHVAQNGPYLTVPLERDDVSLASAEALAPYGRIDFFPRALREAADYVATHTADSDRVQTYGMDPYLLFLAKRRSATPYIYVYDLDADAALAGGFQDGPRPTKEQARIIAAMRDDHERDLLVRLEADPPAAFVLHDRSPLMQSPDATVDFASHCPSAFAWMHSRYAERASFQGIHVWLRLPKE